MAKLSLATNFDDDLLNKISHLNNRFAFTGNKITEIYGSLPSTFGYNSGRSAIDLPAIKFKQLEKHVELARGFGLTFNYILNEVCLGGVEYERKGMHKISKFIEWLAEIEIDVITVSKPFLARLISKQYPNFLVNSSVICGIDSLQKAKEWIDLGAYRLTLSDARNFTLIKRVKKNAKVEIELRANSVCRAGSSLCYFHYLEFSHHAKIPLPISLLNLNCRLARLIDPVDYLLKHGTWIRPEDLDKYDQAGVDIYKILDRACTTKELLVRAKAYLSGSFEGNFLSILGTGKGFKLTYLDNQKLDGFIDHFIKAECPKECKNCNYCEGIAACCLKIGDKKKIRKAISEYKRMINDYLGSIYNTPC